MAGRVRSYSASPAALQHFNSVPHTAALLSSPAYETVPTTSQRKVAPGSNRHAFFAVTLGTPTTIPHSVCLRRKNFSTTAVSHAQKYTPGIYGPPPEEPDMLILFALGTPGLAGHQDTAHGGALAAIMDEGMGLVASEHSKAGFGTLYTVKLEVVYRKPVMVPSTVVCRGWLGGREGRKIWIRGQIVDGKGTVLTEAEGLWVVTKGNGGSVEQSIL